MGLSIEAADPTQICLRVEVSLIINIHLIFHHFKKLRSEKKGKKKKKNLNEPTALEEMCFNLDSYKDYRS